MIPQKIRGVAAFVAMSGACILALLGAYMSHVEGVRQREFYRIVSCVLDDTNYGLCIMDEDHEVIEWNKALERLTGWTLEEMKEIGVEALMDDGALIAKHREVYVKSMADPKSSGKVTKINCIILCKDGKKKAVAISVRILSAFDGRRYAVANIDSPSRVVQFDLTNPPKEVIHQ